MPAGRTWEARTNLAGSAHTANDAGVPWEARREVDMGSVHAPEPLRPNADVFMRQAILECDDKRSVDDDGGGGSGGDSDYVGHAKRD